MKCVGKHGKNLRVKCFVFFSFQTHAAPQHAVFGMFSVRNPSIEEEKV